MCQGDGNGGGAEHVKHAAHAIHHRSCHKLMYGAQQPKLCVWRKSWLKLNYFLYFCSLKEITLIKLIFADPTVNKISVVLVVGLSMVHVSMYLAQTHME